MFLLLSNCVASECMEAICREYGAPLIWQSAVCRFGTQLQQTATVQTELLGWAKVCSGRRARIGDPTAFGVERPVEWPLTEQVGSPVMAQTV